MVAIVPFLPHIATPLDRNCETEKLARSWMRHEAGFLRDYLVTGMEDPRINVQSVLSRHFLLAALFQEKFQQLMEHELQFAAAMNWLGPLAGSPARDFPGILHALKVGADNAEGFAVPHFINQLFSSLPADADGITVPNYIAAFLAQPDAAPALGPALDTFRFLWQQALAGESSQRVSVLEPACGSANDYRFLDAFGIARLIHYSGFDLCGKNVENARAMFPEARFDEGNVFQIAAPDNAFDLCFAHDLFEHLSIDGLELAIKEISRVTRRGLCLSFFQMDEIAEHIVRPMADYHVNTLSMAATRRLLGQHGFAVQPLHIASYLRWRVNCIEAQNPNAYTFLAFRAAGE